MSWRLLGGVHTECTPSAAIYDPLPIILTFVRTGLPFSPMDKLPFTLPFSVGVKVTWIVQLAPADRAVPQVLVWVTDCGRRDDLLNRHGLMELI